MHTYAHVCVCVYVCVSTPTSTSTSVPQESSGMEMSFPIQLHSSSRISACGRGCEWCGQGREKLALSSLWAC